jgi:hypothetical protein
MSSGKAATGTSASMIENLWKEHLQSSANRRANEVRDAYQRKGVLAVEPNYLEFCRHLSDGQRFVLCVLQNPNATCPHWTAAHAVAWPPPDAAIAAAPGLDVGALFSLGASEPDIPEAVRARADAFADFAGCILGITLTDAQLAAVRREVAHALGDPAATAIETALASFEPVRNVDVQRRHAWRQQNQPAYLRQLRAATDTISRTLLQWHADATQVLSVGPPPLTREAAESWVELTSFAAAAHAGMDHGTALPPDIDARIGLLAASYPRLTPQQRSMIALAPIYLYELRRAWPALSAPERMAAEAQLEKQLGAVPVAAAPPAAAPFVPKPIPALMSIPMVPVQTNDATTTPAADESALTRLNREFAEAHARGDHQRAAKLQVQIQMELQNQSARLEMQSNIAKTYAHISDFILGNMK